MDLSLNGNDTITLDSYLLTKFFDKDYGLLSIPNEMATFKVGKLGNTGTINFNGMGLMGELTLRILIGTADDQFINSLQRQFLIDPPSYEADYCQIVKRSGDGQGNITNIIYNCIGGAPIQIPEAHSNSDGDEEQACSVWKFRFLNVSRQIL